MHNFLVAATTKKALHWCALQAKVAIATTKKIQMDTLSGIISLKCVEHQKKIEFKMSQTTTKKKLFISSAKNESPFLNFSFYFGSIRLKITWSHFLFLHVDSVFFLVKLQTFCRCKHNISLLFVVTLYQRVSKLMTGVAVKAEQLLRNKHKTRVTTTVLTWNDWPFVLSFMKTRAFFHKNFERNLHCITSNVVAFDFLGRFSKNNPQNFELVNKNEHTLLQQYFNFNTLCTSLTV